MLWTLTKKQYRECFRACFVNTKIGASRSRAGIAGMFLFYAVIMLVFCVTFFSMASLVGEALIEAGMPWLYFVLMGTLAILLGTFGSVFNTYSVVYLARDNEMLLSMPIPPSAILTTRISLVYGMSLLYSGVVWLPACLYYWIFGAPAAGAVVFEVLLLFLVALLVSVLTCALGWVVALVSSKVKNKSFVIVVLSLILFFGYYYLCMNMMDYLQKLLLNAEALGSGIRTWLNLLYQLGQAATGSLKAMLIFSGVTIGVFTLCFVLLSRSFVRIVTRAQGTQKKNGKITVRASGVSSALLRRELKRFTSSPTYMLNCGFGLVILPVLAVFSLVKQELLEMVLTGMGQMLPWVSSLLPFFVVIMVCVVISMNTISTPSVSLEGKYLWILRSLPVSGRQILRAKLKLHIRLNILPALFAAVVLGYCLNLTPLTIVLIMLYCAAFVWLCGAYGLVLGVLRPNFQWTTETMPIKQSINVMLSMLLGFALPVLTAFVGYLARNLMSTQVYLAVAAAVLTAIAVTLNYWLDTKGAAMFDRLT